MIALTSLKVKGFRAYTEEKEFVFDNPAIFLFGENHRGKSSTLNAIEWCLFGSDCIGKGTGIRERIDWEIPNRNMPASEVLVEVKLRDETTAEELAVSRRWLSAKKDELNVVLPDGQSLTEKEAAEKLEQLLKSSFKDFLTTVYQHQEAIRAILTQEPRERNDAIDRLLGLSDYRNILTGVKAAKLGAEQKKMDVSFDSLAGEIDVALRTREMDLKDKRKEATGKGLNENQLSVKGVLEIAGSIRDELLEFALEISLSIANIEVPEQWTELNKFQEATNAEIKRFRAQMPDVKRQQGLFKKRAEITALWEQYERNEKDWNTDKNKFDTKEKEIQNLLVEQKGLEKKIAEKEEQLGRTNAKGAVISKTRDYLQVEGVDKNICPVCDNEKQNLLDYVEKQWVENYEKLVGNIEVELKSLEEQHNKVKIWFKEYDAVKRRFEVAHNALYEAKRKIGESLNREIADTDDPITILSKALRDVNGELDALEQAVMSKQETLNEIVSSMAKMQLIMNILVLQEKKKIVEEIQQSSEYQRVEKLEDQIAILVDDVEKIKEAISISSHDVAEEKVKAAGEVIDNYFRRIAGNPSINKVEFSVDVDTRTGLNSYLLKDQNGKDITPILSQGDLNALALSIFLGMASSAGTNLPFEFIMLDDPSQSLGSEHKDRLAEVLNEVMDKRMVILSSMDRELQELAILKTTKTKTNYIFSDWTPERGPKVAKN